MNTIQRVAVLGSGTMGSGIAAHLANANIPVLLLDIVPANAENRNILAEKAVARMKQQQEHSPFSTPEKADFVTCGNIEDNLEDLREVDWIIEAVVERIAIKHHLYRTVNPYRKRNSILSSNTSTIPLAELAESLPEGAEQNLCITHFYNPPRFTKLLEIVPGAAMQQETVDMLASFCDVTLGKKVVMVKDTPGFIGNRIGIFWLVTGLTEAIRQNITIEAADSIIGKPVGIPSTGIFGLFDLIGLDVMMDIIRSLEKYLPENDRFFEVFNSSGLLQHMIEEGYTGRKGKGGFYRVSKENGKTVKEALDLKTGSYRKAYSPVLETSREGLRGIFVTRQTARQLEPALAGNGALPAYDEQTSMEQIRFYGWSVMSQTLAYAASLIPEIADDIVSIDTVMRTGYNWKNGPFEMIDQLGTEWFSKRLQADGRPVPAFLQKADAHSLYKSDHGKRFYLTQEANYAPMPEQQGAWLLKDKTLDATPILHTASARLWDIGDGITCLEFTTKMNTLDTATFDCIAQAIDTVTRQFSGMVIGNDAEHFSAGLNLNLVLKAAESKNWAEISRILRLGQHTMMQIKYAPFPVAMATSGLALGGGCEMLLHCTAVQAHLDTYAGLVEVGIGVVPSWGGCKEMMYDAINQATPSDDIIAIISGVFDIISNARPSSSADEARKMGYLRERNHITMNRERLLPDAKALCLALIANYQPPQPYTITLPFTAIKESLGMCINTMMDQGLLTAHDVRIRHYLATILAGGHSESETPITEQKLLDLEHDAFMELIKTRETQERIAYTLKTGKKLRN
jgi:3-hydroxyacyl-CoA dehydrogenase